MSQDICITKIKTYGPPCFIDENNEPNCSYKVTECGINLRGIPRNTEAEKFFQAASTFGHKEILSYEDVGQHCISELGASLLLLGEKAALTRCIDRFIQDAETYLEKLRSK